MSPRGIVAMLMAHGARIKRLERPPVIIRLRYHRPIGFNMRIAI